MQRSRLPAEVTTAQSVVIISINRDSIIPHLVNCNVQVKYRRSWITIRSFSLAGSFDGFRGASDALMISFDSATSICEHILWCSWGTAQDVFNAGDPKSTVSGQGSHIRRVIHWTSSERSRDCATPSPAPRGNTLPAEGAVLKPAQASIQIENCWNLGCGSVDCGGQRCWDERAQLEEQSQLLCEKAQVILYT